MFPEKNNINAFDCIRVSLASPDKIRSWSKGEVTKPETINYRSLCPERDGLFCARIFGPVNDWECLCGKYKRQKFKGVTCDKCGVEVTKKSVRRERMGHIQLPVPVSHIWFVKGVPSRIGYLLDIPFKDLERVLYFEAYAVIESGGTTLKVGEVLYEDKYREYRTQFGDGFKAQMGAEAIKKLLKQVDIEALAIELRFGMKQENNRLKRAKIAKRLKVAEAFLHSGNKPEWMILDVLPVMPPELRPLVPLDGGRFATSDLNDLYRRVINRSNRTKKLLALKAPDVIVRNEKRMLQEAVDALFENGKRGRLLRGVSDRPLKSISDALKGKDGRFRQNLLGKRVDYSGRSVIVVGPDLKLHQCGLPKKMALELFKPFIFNRLEQKNYAATIRQAKEMVEDGRPEVWEVLHEVIKDHPVLLNRAPTLHRLGIQAFQPVLVEGKAIRLHPLVCTAFNADFDGDQMAVHVPLSPMAQIEAKVLMMSTQNILNPANGRPNVVPSQDIVLGGYYLTKKRVGRKGEGMVFANVNDVVAAHDAGVVDTHAIIQIRHTGEWVDTEAWHAKDPKKNSEQEVFETPAEIVNRELKTTTVGRVLFNRALPTELPFINGLLKKEGLLSIVNRAYTLNGPEVTVRMLDALKDLGFEWATRSGISLGMDDFPVPPTVKGLLRIAIDDATATHNQYLSGAIDQAAHTRMTQKTWALATRRIDQLVARTLTKESEQGKWFHSLHAIVDSGARGTMEQVSQLLGMKGLVLLPDGHVYGAPILGNLKQGLLTPEYLTATHGTRKGLIDLSLRSAESGYLLRKLIDVAQDVVVQEEDCQASRGIEIHTIEDGTGKPLISLREQIYGRVCLRDLSDPDSGSCLVPAGSLITESLASLVEASGTQSISIRSPLTCEAARGICAKCYGLNLSTGRLVDLGEAVGIVAAQSIGEPFSQSVMNSKRTGGRARLPGEPERLLAPHDGVLLTSGPEGHLLYLDNGRTVVARRGVELSISSPDLRMETRLHIPRGARLRVPVQGQVTTDAILATWNPMAEPLLAEVSGVVEWVGFVEEGTVSISRDPSSGLTRAKVLPMPTGTRPPLLTILNRENGRVMKSYPLETGMVVEVQDGTFVEAGTVIATLPNDLPAHTDMVSSLAEVVQLFEARTPRHPAQLAKISGRVFLRQEVRGGLLLEILNDSGEKDEHVIPHGTRLLVRDRDDVNPLDPLTHGVVSPLDVLSIAGEMRSLHFMTERLQTIYEQQGLKVNLKHFETILRQMARWVVITDVGDTPLLVDEKVDRRHIKGINEQAIKDGGVPATYEPLLLGITKAALISESFISAASFQETTRVLTEAALGGRVDHLRGLKENVILGRLIPAGTGAAHYRNLEIEEGKYPEPSLNEFGMGDDFDDEYARMVQHVEELQGMCEEI